MSGNTEVVSGEPYVKKEVFQCPRYLQLVRFIFLNGPPGSGKDAAADFIEDYLADFTQEGKPSPIAVIKVKFSAKLKSAVHQFLGLPLAHNAFESLKDKNIPEFLGSTPRNAYIKFSEGFAKSAFGTDVWSEMAWRDLDNAIRRIYQDDPSLVIYVIFTDLGFQSELDFFKKKIPTIHTAIARLNRPGHSFDGDSRGYVFGNSGLEVYEKAIHNHAGLGDFQKMVERFTLDFMKSDYEPSIQKLVSHLELPPR